MALDELKSKDFAYVHVELPDQVVYDPDVKAKVRAIEEVDAEFVGPFLAGMTALGPYRLVTVSDPQCASGNMAQAHWPYAYQDRMARPSGSGRRFTEVDAKAMTAAPRMRRSLLCGSSPKARDVALIVQKYGGTSVGSIERIHRVADRVEQAVKDGNKVIVVLSAMSGETDRLMKLAHDVAALPDERELDMLLSTGERVTIALLAMELRGRGLDARSFTGRQVGIMTDSAHTRARITRVAAERIRDALSRGVIPQWQVFKGSMSTPTSRRWAAGSDLTAVALAGALKADRCVIFTDVDGVYTADPNIVPSARRINRISYEEMLEMASLGAKVLQSRSVEFAAKYNVPLEVNSSFKEGKGTLVKREDADMEAVAVSGITGDRNQAKITLVGVPDRPGIAARLLSPVAKANILVDMIIQNVSHES